MRKPTQLLTPDQLCAILLQNDDRITASFPTVEGITDVEEVTKGWPALKGWFKDTFSFAAWREKFAPPICGSLDNAAAELETLGMDKEVIEAHLQAITTLASDRVPLVMIGLVMGAGSPRASFISASYRHNTRYPLGIEMGENNEALQSEFQSTLKSVIAPELTQILTELQDQMPQFFEVATLPARAVGNGYVIEGHVREISSP